MYRICDLLLSSDLDFPELDRAEGGKAEFAFRLLPEESPAPVSVDWLHHWRSPDDEITLSFARHGLDWLLQFPELARFQVSADGRDVRCHRAPGVPLETIRHLFLDQVVPLTLNQRGRLVLHASTVLGPRGAVAFLGETGRGKSTLSASLTRLGWPVLTDDCLMLEERAEAIFAVPSYPGLRLWSDTVAALFREEPEVTRVAHYTTKKRLGANGSLRFSHEAAPVQRMYVLNPGEVDGSPTTAAIVRLTPRAAFVEMVKVAFKMDITDRTRIRDEFERLARIARLPLFYSLTFPRDLSRLPAVREAILDHQDER